MLEDCRSTVNVPLYRGKGWMTASENYGDINSFGVALKTHAVILVDKSQYND